MSNFDDLVGSEGLSPEDELRLRQVHDLLVQAGPPPDLSPELRTPSLLREEPKEVPLLFRRRRGLTAVLALAATVAAFAGGYAFGHGKAKPAAFVAEHTVLMHGKPGVHGVIQVAAADQVGNWPMLVEVSGLPEQQSRGSYYELWLTKNGKPAASCGAFRVHGKTTRVRLSVPYSLRGYDGWVVTSESPTASRRGPIVMTT